MHRIGLGYDIHRLVAGRKLILGGTHIPHEKGLLGHSDADVLVHAVCDAFLGAVALGDIGDHFPDTESRYKDISSIKLLKEVYEKVKQKGYTLANLDATIFAQEPKLSPFKKRMAIRMAECMDVDPLSINVKATTTEGLGAVGKGDGIAAMCIVLLQ
jgi:2-C-methyl-D-erythritol 2,4-cyclodiphosphate synthase